MIAVMKETDYMKKPTFLKNAWAAFKEVRSPGTNNKGPVVRVSTMNPSHFRAPPQNMYTLSPFRLCQRIFSLRQLHCGWLHRSWPGE